MTADHLAHRGATTRPSTSDAAVPEQTVRSGGALPADRIVRQVQAIDAWIATRRERERALRAPRLSRDERMAVDRQIEVLRRTHDAIKGHCARDLDAELEPMRWPGTTAVVAHRHAWFAEKLALALQGQGVSVLACTDNGAEALGAVVAEQPDVLLVGDRLAMMTGVDVLAEARRFAPTTLRAVQAGGWRQSDPRGQVADAVLPPSSPPSAVAEALLALHRTARGVLSRA